MTIWYFDSVNGSDSNDGKSIATAKKTYTPTGGANGDTYLFKRGTTQTVTVVGQWIWDGVSDTQRARYGAYGVAQVPYSTWKYGAASGNMILNAAGSKYIDFEDMYFDMRNTNCRTSLYCAAQGTNQTIGNTIRRCFFQGSNDPVNRGGNGLNLYREPSATVWPTGYVIEDCEFFDNEGHGLFIQGSQNIIVRRCKFYRNGQYAPTGGHGFSAGALNTTASSGWTNTAGTVWQRTLTGAETTVYYVQTSVAAYPKLRLTAGTQTAPAVGEFGLAAGVLYINVGSASNPSSQSINYAWGKCGYLTVEDCEAYSNYWNLSAPYHEGHGFAFDDYSDDSKFLRNKSYNNQGAGFSNNQGARNLLFGNIAYNNGIAGVVFNPSDNLQIIHNTFYSNNNGTSPQPAEIYSNGYSKNGTISNNILLPTVNYGISTEATDTSFAGTTNCIYGALTSAEKTPFLTGTINVSPNLDSGTRPQEPTLIRVGSYVGGKDFNGKQFYNPPNIGAIDDVTANPRYILLRS